VRNRSSLQTPRRATNRRLQVRDYLIAIVMMTLAVIVATLIQHACTQQMPIKTNGGLQ